MVNLEHLFSVLERQPFEIFACVCFTFVSCPHLECQGSLCFVYTNLLPGVWNMSSPTLCSAIYFERINFYLHACKCVCLGGDMDMSIGALGPEGEIRFTGARVTGDSEPLDCSAGH